MSDAIDAARQDAEKAPRSVVRAREVETDHARRHFKWTEWIARGCRFLFVGMIELSILFTAAFAAIAVFLRPNGPNDLRRIYETAAIALAVGICAAAFYNRIRLRYQGRSANLVQATVELFRPLLFTAFFILATLFLQFPLFAVFFLRLCFLKFGLATWQDRLQQYASLICVAFVLVGLLSIPAIYLYRSAKWKRATKVKDQGEEQRSIEPAPTFAETAWSAEAALTGPAMFAFVGFIVSMLAMVVLGGRP
jgi:hypothetical protein